MSFVEIKTDKGHDAFLLDEPEMFGTVRGFLNAVAATEGREHERRQPASRPGRHRGDDPPRHAGAGCRLRRRRAAGTSVRTKNVDGRGIELSQQNVNACVARGLSVMQGDADTDLVEYPSRCSTR